MDIDWNRIHTFGASIGFTECRTVFFGEYSHLDGSEVVLTDSEGHFIYITADQIEEVEYHD